MWSLLKSISFATAPAVIVCYSWELYKLLHALPDCPRLQTTGWGFLGGCGFWMVCSRHLGFWLTLEHELTHSIVALLFFRRIHNLTANESDGFVTFAGLGNNFVINLAPYFLPTASIFWVAFYAAVRPEFMSSYLAVLGFFTGYHVASNIQEFHFQQPDIQQSGAWFSVFFCAAAAVLCLGFICGVAVDGLSGGSEFVCCGARTLGAWAGDAWTGGSALVSWVMSQVSNQGIGWRFDERLGPVNIGGGQ
jgi:hypothetical protein